MTWRRSSPALRTRMALLRFGDLTYTYDAAGRRKDTGGSFARIAFPQPLASSTYNANNQLTQRGSATLVYDQNGNLTSDGVNTYTWNARNQLVSISGAGMSASFSYDSFGRRKSKTVNGTTTEFLYDGPNAVQEKNGGSPSANMIMGGVDQTFTRTDAGGARHFFTDGLGTTVGLADAGRRVNDAVHVRAFRANHCDRHGEQQFVAVHRPGERRYRTAILPFSLLQSDASAIH